MNIIDMDECKYSSRHAKYLGNAGDKDGIIYDGDNWIVKYPKSTKGMSGNMLPDYTSSPLSEYIGSKVYEILEVPVHQVKICYRNDQIAVACKDFQKQWGDLVEIRGIKNAANRQIHKDSKEDMPISATGDNVILEELFLHFEKNPMLQDSKIQERFWESVIVDALIDNNDRNNGNWGLLYNHDKNEYEMAPVYDNGNSFMNKTSDERICQLLNNPEALENMLTGTRTIYSYNDKILSAKKMLNFDSPELRNALIKMTPLIEEKMEAIRNMIDEIPETYQGKTVCSKERKNIYFLSMEKRLEKIIEPAYEKALEIERIQDENKDDNDSMDER